jgi:hypothetical protein
VARHPPPLPLLLPLAARPGATHCEQAPAGSAAPAAPPPPRPPPPPRRPSPRQPPPLPRPPLPPWALLPPPRPCAKTPCEASALIPHSDTRRRSRSAVLPPARTRTRRSW